VVVLSGTHQKEAAWFGEHGLKAAVPSKAKGTAIRVPKVAGFITSAAAARGVHGIIPLRQTDALWRFQAWCVELSFIYLLCKRHADTDTSL
jgi:hypothetical protein